MHTNRITRPSESHQNLKLFWWPLTKVLERDMTVLPRLPDQRQSAIGRNTALIPFLGQGEIDLHRFMPKVPGSPLSWAPSSVTFCQFASKR
jgi:hypothetical protein